MDMFFMLAVSLLLPFIWAHSPLQQTDKPSYSPPSCVATQQFPQKNDCAAVIDIANTESTTTTVFNQLKEVMTAQHQETKKIIEEKQEIFEKKITDLLQKTSPESSHSFISDLFDHKVTLVFFLGIIIYGSVWWHILQARSIIQQPKNWSSWQDDLTLETLLTKKKEELEAQLLLSIAHYYTDPKNPTDFVHPLMSFSSNIQQEIDASQKLLRIYKTIQQLKMEKLFNITEQDTKLLEADIQKLLYIVQIFTTWHSTSHPIS